MTEFNKVSLRERLEKSVVYEQVLPALTGAWTTRAALRNVAGNIRHGDFAEAASIAFDHASNILATGLFEDSAVPELTESEPISDQVADFADAGFNFVRVSNQFQSLSLAERASAGGAGSVSRVMRLDDTLLLETDRINVRLHDDCSDQAVDDFARRNRLVFLRRAGMSGTAQFLVQDDFATYKCLELLEREAVVFSEPDYIERIGQRYVPRSPEFSKQWHHAVIDAPLAWNITRGSQVRVAFIDSGFHIGVSNLTFDPQFSAWYRSTASSDDAEFMLGLGGMPAHEHGTACAAMIAMSDNDTGGIGVAFESRLRVIACLNSETIGTQTTLARALIYAVDPSLEDPNLSSADGVDVIGCSLGPSSSASWQMRLVLKEALDDIASYGRNGLGAPVLWACTNGDHPISFDEVCSHPEVMAVGRSTINDQDNGSGFGPELEFLAPGVDVYLPNRNGSYRAITGTSFACPCAAGVAALVLSKDKALTAGEVRQRIREGCDRVGSQPYNNGRNDRFGYGRINARAVV